MSESLEIAAPSLSETRTDVAETCARTAVRADRRVRALLSGLFADKVLLDHTSLNGGEPVLLTPQEIADAWSATLGRYDVTQHLIANRLVHVDGDDAVCTASFQVTHRLAAPHGGRLCTLGGDHRWELARTGGRWLIASAVMTATWGDGNQGLPTQASGRMR